MTHLHWSSQLLPSHAPSSSSHTLASFFSPLCSRRDGGTICSDHTLTYHVADHHDRSPFLGSRLLPRNRSSEIPKGRGRGRRRKEQNLRGACSSSLESFPDDNDDQEEFVMRLQELAFQLERQEEDDGMEPRIHSESRRNLEAERSCGASTSYDDALPSSHSVSSSSLLSSSEPSAEPPWLSGRLEPPDWPASVERNANRVDLPLSLRIIKRKKQQRWVEGSLLREAACCSVKKAFSSMVFIVRELHSFALQMQQTLFCEDIQGILARVQQEIHASFVWLFQRIFSCTPTLMVSLMLLLANYTVYSMGHYSTAIAAPNSAPPHRSAVVITHHQRETKNQPRFDRSSIKTFSVTGRTASVGGSGGGGGRKVRPVAGATDDGRSDGSSSSSYRSRPMPPNGISTVPATGGGKEGSSTVMEEEAARTWSKIVEEASRMQASSRDGALMDLDTLKRLVSPVMVELEPEDRSDYLRTELNYQQFLAQEPDNPLLLSNFAQFLYLVLHDHDRAEHYFKRAVGTEPVDAEALGRYASFLWLARKDLAAAEETYLEAIAAEPGNTVHAANYAHFLWSTGGEDTCYPLDADDA